MTPVPDLRHCNRSSRNTAHPEEIASAYREIEGRISPPLAKVSYSDDTGNGAIVRVPDKIENRQYDFSDFSAVDIGDAFSFEITRADSYTIAITAGADLFEHIDVSKDGRTLKINVRPVFNFRNTGPLKAVITMPDFTGLNGAGAVDGTISGFQSTENVGIHLSGASEVVMTDISAGDMECILSGASELELIDLKTNDAGFNLSGASDLRGGLTAAGADFVLSGASSVRLNGTADDLAVNASGASDITLSDFTVHNADIDLSGASECRVNADSELGIKLSGGSKLVYYGNPSIKSMDITSGSEVTKK
jgi:hypothetical protein